METKMSRLGIFLRQSLIVKLTRFFRIKGEVVLVLPAELKTSLGKGVVPKLGGRVSFSQVGRMGSQLVGNHTFPHIFSVRKPQMLLRRGR